MTTARYKCRECGYEVLSGDRGPTKWLGCQSPRCKGENTLHERILRRYDMASKEQKLLLF